MLQEQCTKKTTTPRKKYRGRLSEDKNVEDHHRDGDERVAHHVTLHEREGRAIRMNKVQLVAMNDRVVVDRDYKRR